MNSIRKGRNLDYHGDLIQGEQINEMAMANNPAPGDAGNQAPIQFRTTIGSVSEYKPGEDWKLWEERLEQYFEANYIDDHKRVPVLLTLLGSEAYKTIRDLCDLDLPKSKTYEELCGLMANRSSGRRKVRKDRSAAYRKIKTLKEELKKLKKEAEKYKKRYHRYKKMSPKRNSNTQANTKQLSPYS